MDASEPGTIHAVTMVVTYEIQKEQLAALMRNRPQLADELAHLLSARVQALDHLSTAGDAHIGKDLHPFVERIRRALAVRT